MPLSDILASQSSWARRRWAHHRGRRAPSLAQNLLIPMSRSVAADFRRGKGGELGKPGRAGKMQSLRSSSALAYNFFAPWLGQDLSRLAAALGSRVSDSTIAFERTFPHGLGTIPPHMDVTLDNHQARPLAIECKFSETYETHKKRPSLASKYFPDTAPRWQSLNLPRCQRLADSLRVDNAFVRLDACQLLKHILGLAHSTTHPPRLLYLWYDTGCAQAQELEDDLERFRHYMDESVLFHAVSYQSAFAALKNGPEPVRGYFAYLGSRYFAA